MRELDLFGRWASRWRVIRTSNAYVFRILSRARGIPTSKSKNPAGIGMASFPCLEPGVAARDPDSALERALHQLGRRDRRKIALEGERRAESQKGATRRMIYRDRRRGEVATSARCLRPGSPRRLSLAETVRGGR